MKTYCRIILVAFVSKLQSTCRTCHLLRACLRNCVKMCVRTCVHGCVCGACFLKNMTQHLLSLCHRAIDCLASDNYREKIKVDAQSLSDLPSDYGEHNGKVKTDVLYQFWSDMLLVHLPFINGFLHRLLYTNFNSKRNIWLTDNRLGNTIPIYVHADNMLKCRCKHNYTK